MKAKFLALAALVLGMVSCQTDVVEGLHVDANGEAELTLQVGLPEATRAAGNDSALGAIDNGLDLSKYDIRFILKVYDDNGELAKQCEPKVGDATEAKFSLRLVPGRNYRFVVWADFVTDGTDLHYDTSNFPVISLKDGAAQNLNDESRDAYTAVYEVKSYSSSSKIEPIILTRPFAKLRVITTDMNQLYSDLTSATVKYTSKLYTSFNALNQAVDTNISESFEKTVSYSDATIYSGEPKNGEMTLFADYFFGSEDDRVMFTLDVADGTGYDIPTVNFNTNIPVQRNHLTTVKGNILTDANEITVTIEDAFEQPNIDVEYKRAGTAEELVNIIEEVNNSTTDEETHIVLSGDIDLSQLFTRATASNNVTIASGKEVVLDIQTYTITGVDNETASFGLFNIEPGAKLTIEGTTGKIQLKATKDREWNAYSSVISNQRGEFVLNGGTLEHLGGTAMAYGIDNLTNGKGTKAVTTINGGTVKSTYRAVRQFLNGTEAFNELYVNGGTIDGRNNKSIWMQNASKSVNPGKLVVAENASLYGDVMVSGAGAPELAIELSLAENALKDGFTVIPSNIPAGYDIYVKNGYWVVEKGVEVDGDEVAICNAAGLKWLADQVNADDTFEGKTVKLTADINLKNENWTPIGYWKTFNGTFDGQNHTISNLKHHGTEEDCYVGLFGYTENATIKNLTINNVDLKLVANASWAGGHMGALVGNIEGETVIENIKVTGDVKIDGDMEQAGAGRIGGVVGGNVSNTTFKNVVVNVNKDSFVKGNSSVGGIAGQIQGETTFENCSSNVNVSAQQFYAGGIIGLTYRITSFENCSASGNISVLAGRSGNNNDLYRVGAIAGGWDEDDNGEYVLPLVNCSTTCVLVGKSADGRTATAFDCGGFVGRGYSALAGAKISVNGTVYEYAGNGVYKVGEKYVVATADALVAALANNYDVFFDRDIKIDPANMSNAYGKTGINVTNGQAIDGNGYTINIKGAGGTWDSGINTTGGVIKNITVTGSFRGIFVNHNSDHSEKVVLENVTIDGTVYTISCDQGKYQGLEAKDSTFNGWTSYAATIGEVKFMDCSFGEGSGYAFCRPYAPTEFVGCAFEKGFTVDPVAAVSFENCTLDGVELTNDNIATLVTSTKNVTVK